MLDDCRGRLFEEVLFQFSAAVLQKVVQAVKHIGIAQRLACTRNLDEHEDYMVPSLLLAHWSSLGQSLRRMHDEKTNLGLLEEILHEKRAVVTEGRANACNELHKNELILLDARVEAENFKNQLRQDRSAGSAWLDSIISGDEEMDRDQHIEADFNAMWDEFRSGQPVPFEAHPVGPLQHLQDSLVEQRQRSQRFRDFQTHLSRRNEAFMKIHSPIRTPLKSPAKPRFGSPPKSSKGLPSDRRHHRSPVRLATTMAEDLQSRLLNKIPSETPIKGDTSGLTDASTDLGNKHALPGRLGQETPFLGQVPGEMALLGTFEPNVQAYQLLEPEQLPLLVAGETASRLTLPNTISPAVPIEVDSPDTPAQILEVNVQQTPVGSSGGNWNRLSAQVSGWTSSRLQSPSSNVEEAEMVDTVTHASTCSDNTLSKRAQRTLALLEQRLKANPACPTAKRHSRSVEDEHLLNAALYASLSSPAARSPGPNLGPPFEEHSRKQLFHGGSADNRNDSFSDRQENLEPVPDSDTDNVVMLEHNTIHSSSSKESNRSSNRGISWQETLNSVPVVHEDEVLLQPSRPTPTAMLTPERPKTPHEELLFGSTEATVVFKTRSKLRCSPPVSPSPFE